MDKRTLIFVLALTLTLFFVNMFFESRNAESKQQWKEQQLAKDAEKLKKLTSEIQVRTVKADALPVVVLYADPDATQKLAVGVKSGEAVLTTSWSNHLPDTVYMQQSKGQAAAVTLAKQPDAMGQAVVYRATEAGKLKVAHLPDFGRYDLQLVSTVIDSDELPVAVYLGDYADGHVEVPAEAVVRLQKELQPEQAPAMPQLSDTIALIYTGDGYLPVALYRGLSHHLESLESIPLVAPFLTQQEKKNVLAAGQKAPEKFYVLETPYQQLVFSNYGGALAEINLPFQSSGDPESVVKEIEVDRDMVEYHPYNAYFPAHPYYTAGTDPKGEFVEHSQGVLGGYYPLLRRDLIEKDKKKSVRISPRYYAMNLVSEYPETAEMIYEVKSFDKESIVFEAVQGHRRITKTYSVSSEAQAPYAIDLTIAVEGDSRGLWLTSGVPEVEWISGSPAPALKYRITRNQKSEVENIDLPSDSTTMTSATIDWICNSNGFFGMIMDPLSDTDSGYRAQYVPGTVVPSRLVEIDQEYNLYEASKMPGYLMLLPLKSTGGVMHFRVFAGPFATSILKQVDEVYSNSSTGYNPDYIACQSFHGWFAFISEPFAKFLFILMNFFHSITGSWAFSIILLTVALRVMLYPLNAWSTKSMVKMQQIGPEVTAIQERYKKDPKKAQLEVMNLYRERGVNPVSGCFPLLIQMPFLIGMFDLLKSTFELRGASFIPGWIDNLTAPDVLFSWKMPIFFIGNQFHLLPILLGVVMFVQQTMMSTLPKDRSQWTDQQRQQRVMGNVMAVVFTVMFYHFPSGLNIYWLSSMLLGMVQQYWTTKRMKAAPATAVVLPAPKKKK